MLKESDVTTLPIEVCQCEGRRWAVSPAVEFYTHGAWRAPPNYPPPALRYELVVELAPVFFNMGAVVLWYAGRNGRYTLVECLYCTGDWHG